MSVLNKFRSFVNNNKTASAGLALLLAALAYWLGLVDPVLAHLKGSAN